MTDLKMLALYLGIALVISVVANRSRGLRRLTGSRNHNEKPARRTTNDRYVDVIANSGTGVAPGKLYSRTTFRSTWGLRLVGLALSSCLLFILGRSVLADLRSEPADTDMFYCLGAAALWAYYNIYIFTYRVMIMDGHLINTTWYLGRARYPLRSLKGFEQHNSGFWRLEFEGGRATSVLQYVQGRKTLYKALENALHQDRSAPCPNSPKSKPSAADLSPRWKALPLFRQM